MSVTYWWTRYGDSIHMAETGEPKTLCGRPTHYQCDDFEYWSRHHNVCISCRKKAEP